MRFCFLFKLEYTVFADDNLVCRAVAPAEESPVGGGYICLGRSCDVTEHPLVMPIRITGIKLFKPLWRIISIRTKPLATVII